ncbi:MAG: hypothetical protein OXG44_03980, partial [Gammaproteobacteria bacterium]|nr:hypothetical protein [Gammaproteobacteria bacterium]
MIRLRFAAPNARMYGAPVRPFMQIRVRRDDRRLRVAGYSKRSPSSGQVDRLVKCPVRLSSRFM